VEAADAAGERPTTMIAIGDALAALERKDRRKAKPILRKSRPRFWICPSKRFAPSCAWRSLARKLDYRSAANRNS